MIVDIARALDNTAPYCLDCYQVRFVEGTENRAIQKGWAQFNRARFELRSKN
jgi:hypothetical protein